MVSCTEFIPFYSELFKYIEEKEGHDAVIRYWKHISDVYVEPMLGKLAAEKGIAACWEYWSKTLSEEAADFTMTFDDEKNEYLMQMHHCPSKGMLLALEHMEPYHDYCSHCAYLYSPVLERYGIMGEECFTDVDNAKCSCRYFLPDTGGEHSVSDN